MFKFFKNKKAVDNLTLSSPELLNIRKIEKAKEESIKRAKVLAVNISDDVYILKQFFNITPKVGSYGITVTDSDTAKITLEDSFMGGYIISFFTNYEGVIGFEIKEVEECKNTNAEQ